MCRSKTQEMNFNISLIPSMRYHIADMLILNSGSKESVHSPFYIGHFLQNYRCLSVISVAFHTFSDSGRSVRGRSGDGIFGSAQCRFEWLNSLTKPTIMKLASLIMKSTYLQKLFLSAIIEIACLNLSAILTVSQYIRSQRFWYSRLF